MFKISWKIWRPSCAKRNFLRWVIRVNSFIPLCSTIVCFACLTINVQNSNSDFRMSGCMMAASLILLLQVFVAYLSLHIWSRHTARENTFFFALWFKIFENVSYIPVIYRKKDMTWELLSIYVDISKVSLEIKIQTYATNPCIIGPVIETRPDHSEPPEPQF